jgi:hypothetical protein
MTAGADFLQRSVIEARIEELHADARRHPRSGQPTGSSWNPIARLFGQVRATR